MSIKLFIITVQYYYIRIYLIYIETKLIKKSCIFYQQDHNVLIVVCYILLQTDESASLRALP